MNKWTINQKFKVDDIINVPDRIITKNPHSLTDTLGKITEVQETSQDYSIEMLDGTRLKRHFSDIVSATATKSESDVELINPFQLINWKDRTPPDNLYPKFKLFLEDFKKGVFSDPPSITYENPDDPDLQLPEQDSQDHETVEQRLQAAKEKGSSSGIDIVLLRPTTHS